MNKLKSAGIVMGVLSFLSLSTQSVMANEIIKINEQYGDLGLYERKMEPKKNTELG